MGEPDCRESGVGAQLVVTLCRVESRATLRGEANGGPPMPENGPPLPTRARQYHSLGIFDSERSVTGDELQSGTERMKRKRNERSGGIGRPRQAELFGWTFDRAGSLRVWCQNWLFWAGRATLPELVSDATVMAFLAA
jgi:hypothetical protein